MDHESHVRIMGTDVCMIVSGTRKNIRNKAFGLQLMWQYTWVGYNPSVVKEYSVNMSRYGPSLYHEFTEAVMK